MARKPTSSPGRLSSDEKVWVFSNGAKCTFRKVSEPLMELTGSLDRPLPIRNQIMSADDARKFAAELVKIGH